MKHNHDNALSGGPSTVPVRFEFAHPSAATVCVAGTFNDWQPAAKAMHPLGGGRWLKESALPPGNYEYCLVVDGKWTPDPLAKETVPNPFGGLNSVLRVASRPCKTRPLPQAIKQLAAKKSVTHLSSGLIGVAALLLFQSVPFTFPNLHLVGSQATARSESATMPTQPAPVFSSFCADCAKPAPFAVEYHGVDAWYATTNGNVGHEVTVIQCKSCGHKVSFERQIRSLTQVN